MAHPVRDDGSGGVRFTQEPDGSVTATDQETGIARAGRTRAEALQSLAEALTLAEGGGTPVGDPEEFLREELGIEPEEIDEDPPEFMREPGWVGGRSPVERSSRY